MKLIVQIPCLNEEETLPLTVRDIPRQIEGIDRVEILVIDDGCTDRTVQVAREAGVDHIVRFPRNRGLGHAFQAGLDACLRLGADIIVNTDGDNQYFGGDIPLLIRPILEGKADLVIGDRQPEKIAHFSFTKKLLQKLGSRVVSRLSGIPVPDVASGFRAFNRNAAMRLSCFTAFDHTVDHVIQAGKKRLAVVNVPIRTNEKFRESRLFSSIYQFVARSLGIMVRVYSSYAALKMFALAGFLVFSLGVLLGVRFLYYFLFTPEGYTHVQSLILCAILLLAGFQMTLTGIVADLIAANRSLIEDVAYRVKKLEMEDPSPGPS
jgi:glycosyltransferase involved in cell wall biosynthesis